MKEMSEHSDEYLGSQPPPILTIASNREGHVDVFPLGHPGFLRGLRALIPPTPQMVDKGGGGFPLEGPERLKEEEEVIGSLGQVCISL